MGLMLTTRERMDELESEANSYRIGLEKMKKEHDYVLVQYRRLRDSKDEEIAKLHAVIEDLKAEREEDRKKIKVLRQAVEFYEGKKRCS